MKNKKDNNRQSYILTRETLGMTILLFCALVTLMLLTHKFIFASIGVAICTFMYGTFGYASFVVVALLAYLGEWLVFEKKLKLDKRSVIFVSLTALSLFMLFHAVSSNYFSLDNYGEYIADCYLNAANGFSGYTFGGVLCALIVYPVAKGTTFIGAYVIFAVLSVFCGYLSYVSIREVVLGKRVEANTPRKQKKDAAKEEKADAAVEESDAADSMYTLNDEHEIVDRRRARTKPEPQPEPVEQNNAEEDRYSRKNLGRKILFENGEFAAESYRRNMIFNENSYFNNPVHNDGDYLSGFSSGKGKQKNTQTPAENQTYTSSYTNEVEENYTGVQTPSYLYGDKPADNLEFRPEENSESNYDSEKVDNYSRTIREDVANFEEDARERENRFQPSTPPAADRRSREILFGEPEAKEEDDAAKPEEDIFTSVAEENKPEENQEFIRRSPEPEKREESSGNRLFGIFSADNPRIDTERVKPDVSSIEKRGERSNAALFDDDDGEELFDEEPQTPTRSIGEDRGRGFIAGFGDRETTVTPSRRVAEPAPEPVQEAVKEEKPKHVWKKYVPPTLDLLDDYPETANRNDEDIEESKRIIVETLSNFRIASQISNVVVGPAITRYDVIIEDKTNIKNALKYKEAIAMALMKENVTAYLNYSKGAISIEVPNSSRTVVGLKGLLESNNFINCKQNTLTFALGKNVEGRVVCPDITKMPHLLVAGTTGSGKSICLSALIVSLLYKYGPEELRFVLVDPKQVEFISYDKLPHLMINEIIYDVDKAIQALNWAIKEMENRYQLFKEMTERGIATKNLTEYNAHLPAGEEKLPKIVIILDEFGDLMLQAKKDIESRIIRLVQKARACGIHLILATQRPSVDCITGLIKSNLPTRIGFKVNSFDDARTIFDIGGAEKLLGKGDMYFRSAENPELARIQGCFIDTHEVQKVTDYVKAHNETYFDQSVSDFINTVEEEETDASADDAMSGDAETKIDDTFIKALKFCVTSNQASVSMIQRRFPVGYIKACKIIDWMENMNYVTQSEGSKPRKVLLSKEEFIKTYGEVDD